MTATSPSSARRAGSATNLLPVQLEGLAWGLTRPPTRRTPVCASLCCLCPIQAGSNAPGNLERVRALTSHPAFNISNPNNCYALLLGFSHSPAHFHAADGSGYAFLADAVLKVDGINHQVRHFDTANSDNQCLLLGLWLRAG